VHELAQEVVAQRASMVLFLGDFTLNGSKEELALWTNAMLPIYEAGIPIYPAIGNHDLWAKPDIGNMFARVVPTNGPPGQVGSTYALGFRNALFLVLDQYSADPLPDQWMDAVLSTNTRPHVFAAGHMPAFKLRHPDCLDDYPASRDAFWNTLSNTQARVYFSGHDHFYDHSRIDDGDGMPANDVHQMVVGTGGAPLYEDNPYDGVNSFWVPKRLAHEARHGYVSVKVSGYQVSCTWFGRTETNTYVASPDVFAYTVTPRLFLRHQYDGSRLTLSWDGTATLQVAPQPGGVFTNVAFAASPYSVTNGGQPQCFYRLSLP
jgi:hypothetical protein